MNRFKNAFLAGFSCVCMLLFIACHKDVPLQTELRKTVQLTQKAATSRNAAETAICFSVKYPVTMILFDGSKEKIYSNEEYFEIMEWWGAYEAEEAAPRFKYPIRVVLENGKTKRINNINSLENLLESCAEVNTEEESEEEEGNGENEDDAEEEEDNEGGGNGETDGENEDDNTGATGTSSTTDWFTAINGSKEESHGHYIIQCSDGGYLQVGETGFIPNAAKLLVAKTNSSGQLVWKKEFGSSGHNLGNAALEVSDGYLIVGAINQNSALVKLNKSTGSTIFQKTYNTGGSDAFEHVALTSNGIVAVGYRNALDANNTFYTEGEGFMVFMDNNGNKIADKDLKAYTSHAYRVKRFNNELIVSGLSYGAQAYEVIKMDMAGTILWKKSYGGNSSDHGFGLDLGADGSIFLTGHTLSGTQNWDTYTMKLNNNGQLLWEQKKGNPRGFDPRYIHDEAWDIRATSDGGCIIIAGTGDEYDNYSACQNDVCSDNWEVYAIKYGANGQVEWQQTYALEGGNDWAGEAIDLTADGGAIVGVDNGQFGFLKLRPF